MYVSSLGQNPAIVFLFVVRMRPILILIVTCLTSTAISQNPCQHAFILYNVDSGTEVTRFTDAKYPAQFPIDQSKLAGISRLNLVASFCNNVPPFQSATISVSNLTGIATPSGPTIELSVVEGFQTVTVSGNFLKEPGVYTISASSYSQSLEQGLLLDSLGVAVYVYNTCQRGFILYDTNNQTEIAHFSDFGIHQYFQGLGPVIASTQGNIDLLELGDRTGLNLVAQFCNPLVTNVSFFENFASTPLSVARSPPFAIGPRRRSKLLPSAFLKTPTIYSNALQPVFIAAQAQGGVDELDIYLSVVPSHRVVSYTLVDAATGADLVTSVPSEEFGFVQSSYLEVDLAGYTTDAAFSIRANVVGATQSVGFFLSTTAYALKYIPSPHSNFTANQAPFSMAGLSSSGQYNPVANLSNPGFYYMDGVPFTGFNMTGSQGPIHMLYISVLARTHVTSLTWVNTAANSDISVYSYVYTPPAFLATINSLPQYELDPLQYAGGTTFSIRANPSANVASVEFSLFHIDDNLGDSSLVHHFVANDAPFCLGGNDGNGHCLTAPVLQMPVNISTNSTFNYQLSVTPFSGINKQGIPGSTKMFSVNIRPNFYITKLTLVNANTGLDLLDIDPSELLLDLSRYRPNVKFAIRAYTAGKVGSIAFSLCPTSSCSSTMFDRIVNTVAFTATSLSNNNTATDPFIAIPYLSVPNQYYLRAVPFSDGNMAGNVGQDAGVSVVVLDRRRVSSFTLVNATSGKDISILQIFDNVGPIVLANNIDLSKYPMNITALSVRANTVGIVGSVTFELYRYLDFTYTSRVLVNSTVDNRAPFALGGVSSTGTYQAIPQLSVAGYYGIVATPYSRINKRGVKGTSLEVNITVAVFKGIPI